jgi:cytochrome c553
MDRNTRRIPPLLALARWLLATAAFAILPATAQNVANGKIAYNNWCISCHGFPPVGGPEFAPNNPTLIAQAINSLVPAMAFMRGAITSQEIQDIAAYIGSLQSGPPPPVDNGGVPQFDYTDIWYVGDSESGWGVSITQHPSNKIFAVAYVYDADGKAMWLVLPDGAWTSSTQYTGLFYRVTGPPQTGATFDPSKVTVAQVGTATFAFSDQGHATFSYVVNGVSISKQILRTPF